MEEFKTKVCTKCGEEKPATTEYFYRKASGKYGLAALCKGCHNELNQRWKEENPDKVRAIRDRWIQNNPEKVKDSEKRWRKNNQERVKEIQRRWYSNNKEKSRESCKKWVENNRGKVRKRKKRSTDFLYSNYIKSKLKKQYGLETSEIPSELIEMKRKQLKYYRELKQLKEELK